MEYLKFKSLLRRVIIVPLVVTSAFAGLLLWETFDLNRSLQWVDHTDQILDQSGHLLMLMIDMESGTRGFVATGDESFLQTYLQGAARSDSEFKVLYQQLDDNPQQRKRLSDIQTGYGEWEMYANRIIALRRAGQADPTLYENQQGKRTMDALRAQISEFQTTEEELRAARVQAAHLRWGLMVISCLGLGLGFGIFLAWFTRYHVEKLGTRLL